MSLWKQVTASWVVSGVLLTSCATHLAPREVDGNGSSSASLQTSAPRTLEELRRALRDRAAGASSASSAGELVSQLSAEDVQVLGEHPEMLRYAGELDDTEVILIVAGAVIIVLLIVIAA
jgi:cytochrome c553